MSWSTSFTEPVRKVDAVAAIDRLHTAAYVEGPAVDQCELAKKAVKAILPGLPGPYVMVSISGHANGTGWNKKEGWANDSIYISVTQQCEEDLLQERSAANRSTSARTERLTVSAGCGA
jgi:hypothetical protein